MAVQIYPTIAEAVAASPQTARAPLTWDPVAHLLSRVSFGPTMSSRSRLRTLGPDRWYAEQVGYSSSRAGYAGNPAVAKVGPLLALSPYDLRQELIRRGNEYGWDAMDQLCQVTLGLQWTSTAQLYETLIDFFSNHLNVPNHNGDVWITRPAYDRDVIRKNAMGSFTNMLLASAKHPAMLTYLNLAESTKTAVNENYARELLELHTVGLNYRESDVKNTARVLTGRTVDDNQHYLFDDYIHATGQVKILGFSDPNRDATNGEAVGDAFLRYLAAHPFTATHLAQKLCVRFVSDTPSADLVNAVAQAYLDNQTQILPMISTMLRTTEFWTARGLKVRRPAENVIATLRAIGNPATDWGAALSTLQWVTQGMGNCPLEWPAPNGYPDVAAAWRSAGTLLSIWNMHLALTSGWWGGIGHIDSGTFYTSAAHTSSAAISQMTRRLTGMTFSKDHRASLQSVLGESATTAIGDSSLRWMDDPLAAIILDSPHHALR